MTRQELTERLDHALTNWKWLESDAVENAKWFLSFLPDDLLRFVTIEPCERQRYLQFHWTDMASVTIMPKGVCWEVKIEGERNRFALPADFEALLRKWVT